MSTYQGTCGVCDASSNTCCPAPVLPSYESHLSTSQLRDLKSAAIVYTEAVTIKRAGGVPRFTSHADYIKYRRAQALAGGDRPPCRAPQSAIITQLEAVGCATSATTATTCVLPTAGTVIISNMLNPITTGETSPDPLTYRFYFDISWTAFSDVTSYSYSTTYLTQNIFISTGPLSVRLWIDWDYVGDFNVTILGTNTCGTTLSTVTGLAPCFLAGALVSLEDGTSKPIEGIRVGDKVIGAFGEINTVLALHRPLLGTHTMCRINEEHSTSSHHPHISPDRRFFCLHPAVASSQTYCREHTVINADGVEEQRLLLGLNPSRIEVLTVGQQLQTIAGPKEVATLEEYSLPPETQLYNLVVSGSHTYCVDGYAVTGWPREDDFDYEAWKPRA